MPRQGKSAIYSKKKKELLTSLNKVELTEKLEQKKSDLHEIQDNMAIHANNEGTHNPRELQHKSARYNELKVIRDETINEITGIKNQINENTPTNISNESINIGLGVSATINPMSEEHEIRNENDVKFEDVAKGDILGFTPNSGTNGTTNPAFLKNTFTFGANKTQVGTQEQKKKWLKEKIYNALPLGVKPFIYFFYRYIIKLGFLDGFRGFLFHVLQGFWYRFLVDAKVYEIEKKAQENTESIKETIEKEYKIKLGDK